MNTGCILGNGGRARRRLTVAVLLFGAAVLAAFFVKREVDDFIGVLSGDTAIETAFDYLSTWREPRTLGEAAQTVGLLRFTLDTNKFRYLNRAAAARNLEPQRLQAISNMVAGLESFSSRRFGTNLQAWDRWLKEQGVEPHTNRSP